MNQKKTSWNILKEADISCVWQMNIFTKNYRVKKMSQLGKKSQIQYLLAVIMSEIFKGKKEKKEETKLKKILIKWTTRINQNYEM